MFKKNKSKIDESIENTSEVEKINKVKEEIHQLRELLKVELSSAYEELFNELDINTKNEKVHGVAIGLGNFFEYCRGMYCTEEWVKTKAPYEAAKSIFVEWPNYFNIDIFTPLLKRCKEIYNLKSDLLEELDYSRLADSYDSEDQEETYKVFVETLKSVSEAKDIDKNILLVVSNEDGVSNERFQYMINLLNTEENSKVALRDFGIE